MLTPWQWRGGRQNARATPRSARRPRVLLVSPGTRPFFTNDLMRQWFATCLDRIGARCDDATITDRDLLWTGETGAWAETFASRIDAADMILLMRPWRFPPVPEAWKPACDAIRARCADKPFAEIGYGGPYFDLPGAPHPYDDAFYFDVDKRRPTYPALVDQALSLRISTLLGRT